MQLILYCILQIVCGGKLSRLQRLIKICRKTFAVVSFMQYLLTSFMKLSLENFHWKAFALASLSMKIAKFFHREQFALYGIYSLIKYFFCELL